MHEFILHEEVLGVYVNDYHALTMLLVVMHCSLYYYSCCNKKSLLKISFCLHTYTHTQSKKIKNK